MTQARFIDGAEGWAIYQQSADEISLPEINQALRSRGYRKVSERMFQHYMKLERLGYDDYMSINRLDLRHATNSVFDVVDRSRYMGREIEAPATLYVPTAQTLRTVLGKVVTISEDAAVFVTPSAPALLEAAASTKYNRGVLLFDRVAVERAVTIRDVLPQDLHVRAVLEFRSLLATDPLFEDDRPRTGSTLRVDIGAAPSIYDVMSVWRRSFELYESARAIAETMIQGLPSEHQRNVASTRIRSISLRSPFELGALGDNLIWPVIALIFRFVRTETEHIQGIVQTHQQMDQAESAEDRQSELHEYEIRARRLDEIKSALEIEQMALELEEPLKERLGLEGDAAFDPNWERLSALKNQAVEAASEIALSASGDLGFAEDEQTSYSPPDDDESAEPDAPAE
jgi:hypothetical protein